MQLGETLDRQAKQDDASLARHDEPALHSGTLSLAGGEARDLKPDVGKLVGPQLTKVLGC